MYVIMIPKYMIVFREKFLRFDPTFELRTFSFWFFRKSSGASEPDFRVDRMSWNNLVLVTPIEFLYFAPKYMMFFVNAHLRLNAAMHWPSDILVNTKDQKQGM